MPVFQAMKRGVINVVLLRRFLPACAWDGVGLTTPDVPPKWLEYLRCILQSQRTADGVVKPLPTDLHVDSVAVS